MTRSGVEHNLKVTPYIAEFRYGKRDYVYHFSTQGGLEKFLSEYQENREYIRNSLNNRFKMVFILGDDFCDVQLYKRIERRGFLITVNGDDVEWLGRLYYDGQKLEATT